PMPDLLLAASSPNAGIALFAAITTDLVAEIQRRHDLWPTASAAVGRLTTGAVLFGAGLKGRERVSLQIAGSGPLSSVSAEAWLLDDATIGARGMAARPHVDLPIDRRGKFDVGGAIGQGSLQVTKSYEIGQPYVGVVPLHSGEIAEDLAMYLAQSEQIPSVVALGVLANPEGIVAAGGVLAQILPGADEAAIAKLEERALAMPPVTSLIASTPDAGALMASLAGDLELRAQRRLDVRFACLCTREKVEAALLGLGRAELLAMSDERDVTEATCEYCKKPYAFSPEELRALAARLE
ncbi:MAG: Hsp33 family molecular chaperone HslO, partial [Candidatus Eremiobacteraeota bacterium]|nr:Hsp33 family molecular chaperone HslO [Candidatus Eremiobacteraeota bacterium]